MSEPCLIAIEIERTQGTAKIRHVIVAASYRASRVGKQGCLVRSTKHSDSDDLVNLEDYETVIPILFPLLIQGCYSQLIRKCSDFLSKKLSIDFMYS